MKKTNKKRSHKKIVVGVGAMLTLICGMLGMEYVRVARYWEKVRPDEVVK